MCHAGILNACALACFVNVILAIKTNRTRRMLWYTLFFYRQLDCLAFSLRFWPKIKSLPSLRLDFFFQNSSFLLNRVKINYKTKQLLSDFYRVVCI